ncbi:MAG: hypothetical protein EBT75_07310 [Proteobacteria bacterium]|jgi:hypothetical protein|nr:hypothetical protein [Pseudomonadota bacterium]
MTLTEMTTEQLADEWRAIHRCVHETSMSARDLYRLIHLDMELEARGLEPVVKVELKETK